MADHILRMYLDCKEKIKNEFTSLTSKISFTCDLWTSPNHYSIFGITAHWIDEQWGLKEVILSAKELDGNHGGDNLAGHFLSVLEDFGNCGEQFYCITTDNASNNFTMGRAIETKLSTYKLNKHVLGCVCHVLNLGAKDALSMLNSSMKEVTEETEEGTEDRLKRGSVYHRIHKFAVAIRNSPQKDQKFRKIIDTLHTTQKKIKFKVYI